MNIAWVFYKGNIILINCGVKKNTTLLSALAEPTRYLSEGATKYKTIIGGTKMFTKTEITHSFNASRDLVFKAFTESEHLQNWWGPKGWAFDISKFEICQDGVLHYSQTSPDGNVMWVKFVYHEVNASEKLVYTSFFSDEEGNIVRAPFNDNWPLETLNTFTFTEH